MKQNSIIITAAFIGICAIQTTTVFAMKNNSCPEQYEFIYPLPEKYDIQNNPTLFGNNPPTPTKEMIDFYDQNNESSKNSPFTLNNDIINYCHKHQEAFLQYQREQNTNNNSENNGQNTCTGNTGTNIDNNVDPQSNGNAQDYKPLNYINPNYNPICDYKPYPGDNTPPKNNNFSTHTKIVAIIGTVAAVSGIAYVAYHARYYWNKFFGPSHATNKQQ